MKHLWSWKTLETDIGKIVEGGEQLDMKDITEYDTMFRELRRALAEKKK